MIHDLFQWINDVTTLVWSLNSKGFHYLVSSGLMSLSLGRVMVNCNWNWFAMVPNRSMDSSVSTHPKGTCEPKINSWIRFCSIHSSTQIDSTVVRLRLHATQYNLKLTYHDQVQIWYISNLVMIYVSTRLCNAILWFSVILLVLFYSSCNTFSIFSALTLTDFVCSSPSFTPFACSIRLLIHCWRRWRWRIPYIWFDGMEQLIWLLCYVHPRSAYTKNNEYTAHHTISPIPRLNTQSCAVSQQWQSYHGIVCAAVQLPMPIDVLCDLLSFLTLTQLIGTRTKSIIVVGAKTINHVRSCGRRSIRWIRSSDSDV